MTDSAPTENYPLLTPEEARAELTRKGWTSKTLAMWWDFRQEHVIRMISNPNRKRRDDDAIRGLPVCPPHLSKG